MMPPPRAHDAHPVSPPLSGFIAEALDAEHNERWIELFPRAVRRLERICVPSPFRIYRRGVRWNVHVLSGLELGIDAEHNKRWIKLFPRAVRRLERIWYVSR
ncbi:peptidaseC15,pyroglutamyl peptidaseI-likeprotein [Moniliophthora roreri]|nr:peptidaseC15,pyroglutamyl peptidaseI-likeprotein [Moniliophthora roreri]